MLTSSLKIISTSAKTDTCCRKFKSSSKFDGGGACMSTTRRAKKKLEIEESDSRWMSKLYRLQGFGARSWKLSFLCGSWAPCSKSLARSFELQTRDKNSYGLRRYRVSTISFRSALIKMKLLAPGTETLATSDPLNFKLAIKSPSKRSWSQRRYRGGAATLDLLNNFHFRLFVSANKLWRPAYRAVKS